MASPEVYSLKSEEEESLPVWVLEDDSGCYIEIRRIFGRPSPEKNTGKLLTSSLLELPSRRDVDWDDGHSQRPLTVILRGISLRFLCCPAGRDIPTQQFIS